MWVRFLLFALWVAVFGVSVQPPARAAEPVVFDNYPVGSLFQEITSLWKQEAEYAEYVKALNMVPAFALATADVNGDGTPEIFARHTDIEMGYCDVEGITCRLHIYQRTPQGLREIGRVMAGVEVKQDDQKTNGYADLLVMRPDKGFDRLIWTGVAYEKR